MYLKARTVFLTGAMVTALTASAAPALAVGRGPAGPDASGAASLAWGIVASPSPPSRFHKDGLSSVFCVSARACIAVGASIPHSLAERWNGMAWSLVATPPLAGGGLAGVSCISARACTAVGGYVPGPFLNTLVETWNGSRWTVVPSPNKPSAFDSLDSVFCVSARACMAVGSFQRVDTVEKTLAEIWNGSRWSLVPSPNVPRTRPFDNLAGVSCVSATACTAVGASIHKTLIESWNGTAWSIVPSPNGPAAGGPSDLTGVSCLSASACTAVGSAGVKTLIESWNGTAWSIVPSPSKGPASTFNTLDSVSCVSATACTAVGEFEYLAQGRYRYRTLIETWNGKRWTIVPSPNKVLGISFNGLGGVSCASAAMCAAVGGYGSIGSKPGRKTLTELGTPAN